MIDMIPPMLPPDIDIFRWRRRSAWILLQHTIYRAPLQAAFGPRAMLARKGEIEALANALIDKVSDNGACEFITDIAEPLPVQVFLEDDGVAD